MKTSDNNSNCSMSTNDCKHETNEIIPFLKMVVVNNSICNITYVERNGVQQN